MNFPAGLHPILVTGATGFIGSHLSHRLALMGAVVIGTGTPSGDRSRLRGLPANFTPETTDLRDPEALNRLFAKYRFATVFHLAASGVHAKNQEARSMTDVNVLGSFALGQAALRHGVARFVYCGSGFEYRETNQPIAETAAIGAPNIYGASKAAGWMLLDYLRRVEGLPLVTIRPFTAFGPAESGEKLIPYVIRTAMRGEPLRLSAGNQVRDYTYVTDVVDALLLGAGDRAAPGDIFNIGAGAAEARSVRWMVETTLGLMGAPKSLCRFGEACRARPDPPALISNPALAKSRLGWTRKVGLKQGLENTIAWAREESDAMREAAA